MSTMGRERGGGTWVLLLFPVPLTACTVHCYVENYMQEKNCFLTEQVGKQSTCKKIPLVDINYAALK